MSTIADDRGARARPGIVLRLWLGYVVLAGLWSAYRYATIIEDLVAHNDPRWNGDLSWALPALLGLSLLNVLAALLLAFGLRLGFLLILLGSLAAATIAVVLQLPLLGLLPGLVGLAVLAVLVQRNRGALR
ncbi:MAG: hypothetical protein R3F55_10010 [Alphaproteobacteria bacterium]